jgi:hypothetical protein
VTLSFRTNTMCQANPHDAVGSGLASGRTMGEAPDLMLGRPSRSKRLSFPGFPGHPTRRVSSGLVHGIEDDTQAEEAHRRVQA